MKVETSTIMGRLFFSVEFEGIKFSSNMWMEEATNVKEFGVIAGRRADDYFDLLIEFLSDEQKETVLRQIREDAAQSIRHEEEFAERQIQAEIKEFGHTNPFWGKQERRTPR